MLQSHYTLKWAKSAFLTPSDSDLFFFMAVKTTKSVFFMLTRPTGIYGPRSDSYPISGCKNGRIRSRGFFNLSLLFSLLYSSTRTCHKNECEPLKQKDRIWLKKPQLSIKACKVIGVNAPPITIILIIHNYSSSFSSKTTEPSPDSMISLKKAYF